MPNELSSFSAWHIFGYIDLDYRHRSTDLNNIYEDAFLKIAVRQNDSDSSSGSVLLSFTGIGHGMGGINVQKPEFFGAGKSFDNVIFITDVTRSWGNLLDFSLIEKCLAPYIENRDVYAIGNSMGGFNSIIASKFICVKKSISFVPQFSVNPSVVPWETRWRKYTSEIPNFCFDSVEDYMTDRTNYYIFSGGEGLDHEHAKLFPIRSNVFHYSFSGIAHDVGKELKENHFLDTALHSCFEGHEDINVGLPYDQLSPAETKKILLVA